MGNARFLTWLGAKEKLLNYMSPHLPTHFNNYYEPFLGSGSMFFHLADRGNLDNSKVYLSDTCSDLIMAYTGIKNHLPNTLFHLENHFKLNSQKYFKHQHNKAYDTIAEIAANFIYLNKASYGGIYRTTLKGLTSLCFRDEPLKKFNTFDYFIAHTYLQRCNISLSSFGKPLYKAKENDFVYLDPPYESFHQGSKKAQYNGNFGVRQHDELEKVCHHLTDNGIKFMLSNSDCEGTRYRYKRYNIIELDIKYRFTKNSLLIAQDKKELLITNY